MALENIMETGVFNVYSETKQFFLSCFNFKKQKKSRKKERKMDIFSEV